MRTTIILAAVAASATLPLLADTPEAVSADCVYAADTLAQPRGFKTAADIAANPVTCRAGETVTLTAPDGTTVTTVVADAPSDTTAALPINAGGLWTATNSKQGVATFVMRYSYYGTQGAGTAADPAKLVDGDELVDLTNAGTAGDGYVFTLIGRDTLLDDLVRPAGFRLEEVSDGAWRILSSPDGCEYVCGPVPYVADTKKPGPDRTLHVKDLMPVAYSGDDWARALEAASTLTLTSPSGVVTEHNLAGTDALTVCFNEAGVWHVTLAAGGNTLESLVDVRSTGTFIIFR